MASSKRSKKQERKGTKTPKKKRVSSKKKTSVPKSLRSGALPTSVSDVMAAGLGALREAQSSGGKQFDALVKRGREVQTSGTKAARDAAQDVEDAVDRALQTVKSAGEAVAEGVQDRVEAAVESVLLRLGVPTRDEVLSLQATVDALETRLFDGASASSSPVDREAFAVRKLDAGWGVLRAGAEEPVLLRSTKKQALFEARALARTHVPSELAIYKMDGTIGDTTTYDA
ncbi:MAG: phasin family protein [Bacteroidota bacterium]